MLKKSKVIAVLSVCVMMFAVVQPAFAWGNRTGSQTGDAVAYGAGAGAVAAGVAAGALIFFTGGLATPFVIGAAAVAGTAGAAGGAYYGYNVEEKSLVKDAAVIAGAGAGGGVVAAATPVVAPVIAGLTAGQAAVGAGGAAATVSSLKDSTVQAVNENKDTIKNSLTSAFKAAPGEFVKGVAKGAGSAVGALGVAYVSSEVLSTDIEKFLAK